MKTTHIKLDIGQKITEKEFKVLKKNFTSWTFTAEGLHKLGDDWWFQKNEDDTYTFISTKHSRAEKITTGGYIYSFERKKSKSYYGG